MSAREDHTCSRAAAPVAAPTQQQLDKMAVRNLDSYMEAVSKPSQTLERIKEKRRARHAQALSDMEREMAAVSASTEQQVQFQVDALNGYIDEQTAKIKGLCERVQVPTARKNQFEETIQTARDITLDKKQHVAMFTEKVVEFERIRLEELKNILKKYYELMCEIQYETLYDVQKFFEHRIMEVNQLALNNLRGYEDVKLQLTQLAHGQLLDACGQLQLLRGTWAEWQRELADIAVTDYAAQMEDCEPQFFNSWEGRNLLEVFKDRRLQLERLVSEWPEHIDYPPSKDMCPTEELQKVLGNLDSAAKNLLSSYQLAVQQSIVKFRSWLKDLRRKLLADGICDAEQVECMEGNHEKLLTQTESLLDNEVKGVQARWSDTVDRIESRLGEPKKLLAEGASLWADHLQRVCRAKTAISRLLEQQRDEGVRAVENKEVELSIAVDDLRQEWQQEALDKALAEIPGILEDIESIHTSNHLKQIEIVNKYQDVADTEQQIFIAEIKMFLATNYGKTFTTELFDEQYVLEIPSVMQREMEMCNVCLVGVQAWKERLEDAMARYLGGCEAAARAEAGGWIGDRTDELGRMHELTLAVHGARLDGIREAVRDVRLVEIETHQRRLRVHQLGIQEHLDTMQQYYREHEKKADELGANMEFAQRAMDSEVDAVAIISDASYLLKNQAEKLFSQFSGDLKLMRVEFLESCERRACWLQQCNLDFVRAIRLFSENGNFSSDEANYFLKTLNDLSQKIDQEYINIKKKFTSRNNLAVQTAQRKLDKLKYRLDVVVEDLQFDRDVLKALDKLRSGMKEAVRGARLQGEQLGESVTFASAAIGRPELSADAWWQRLLADVSARAQLLFSSASSGNDTDEPAIDGLVIFHTEEVSKVPSKVPQKVKSGVKNYYKDYTIFLKPPPPGIESFLVTTNRLMWDYFCNLQETAQNFYTMKKARPVLKLDVVQPDYDSFMMAMLETLRCYHSQYVQIWLHQILELLRALATLDSVVAQHAERSVCLFFEDETRKLLDERRAFQSALGDVQRCHDLQRERLDARLGSPSSSNMLESLARDVRELASVHLSEMATRVAESTEQLNLALNEYENGLATISEALRSVLDQVLYSGLSRSVATQAQKLCSLLQASDLVPGKSGDDDESDAASKGTDGASNTTVLTEGEQTTSSREPCFDTSDEFTKDCEGSYKDNIKRLAEDINEESTRLSDRLAGREGTSADDLTVENVSAAKMHEYQTLFQETVQHLGDQLPAYEEKIQSWKEMWTNNTEEIKKLYKLHYA